MESIDLVDIVVVDEQSEGSHKRIKSVRSFAPCARIAQRVLLVQADVAERRLPFAKRTKGETS